VIANQFSFDFQEKISSKPHEKSFKKAFTNNSKGLSKSSFQLFKLFLEKAFLQNLKSSYIKAP
jgi:hypothetical protein